jgi:hypothetical protein
MVESPETPSVSDAVSIKETEAAQPELPGVVPNMAVDPQGPLGFVYGGTCSSFQDAVNQRKRFDAEHRRGVSDNLFQQTRDDPGSAHMYSRKLQGNAYVILEYRDGEGHVLEYLECDITVSDPDEPEGKQLSMCIPCPICVMQYSKLVGDSIMLLQQKNRAFVLDPKGCGELWVNPNDPASSRMRAGTVTSEPFRCQNGCHTRWVIDKDHLRLA